MSLGIKPRAAVGVDRRAFAVRFRLHAAREGQDFRVTLHVQLS